MTNIKGKSFLSIASIVVISLVIHVLTLVANSTFMEGLKWIHVPFHSVIETAGAAISFFVAYFLLQLRRNRKALVNVYNCLAAALFAMGILDGLHGIAHVGKEFVWLHSIATFIGGVIFCSLFFSSSFLDRHSSKLPGVSLVFATVIGVLSFSFPEYIPVMVVEGHFSLTAQLLNVVGGVCFALSAGKLWFLYRDNGDLDTFLFFLHTALFGAAAILFEQSKLWDTAWWGWHILRFMAYAVALYFIVKSFNEELNSEREEILKKLYMKSKMASMGELAAGVGHEINNPLTVIRSYSKSFIKKNANLEEKEKEKLERILIATDRISNIVKGLRTFARSEDREEDAQESFSVSELLKEVDFMLSEMYSGDGVSLEVKYDRLPLNLVVKGSRVRFQQILINLIQNSKDALKSKKDKRIEVSAEFSGGQLEINVKDNGSGIPTEYLEKIFDPFFTTKDVGEGTGIGLSLVHRFVVEEFHGEINVRSKPDKGTKFQIHFPAKVDKAFLETSNIEDSTSKEQEEPGALAKKVKVLVVEDELMIAEHLEELLSDMGFEVSLAANGKEAIDNYLKDMNQFSLVISDIKMPVITGITLFKEVLKKYPEKRPHLLLYTGGVNTNVEKSEPELFNALSGFFYKPFEDDYIEKIIEELEIKSPSKVG